MSFDFDNLPADDAAVIQKHSLSFSLASRLLPVAVRDDVRKLYAWCRWCDDAVDEAASSGEAKERLELLRRDVELIYLGQPPQHPASKWLASLVDQYGIPSELPLDLLCGMETDLDGPVIETVDDLLLYCYRAAGTVGLMMCRIMGVTDRNAFAKAKALGMAMQLTNIARDIKEDWESHRRYLPAKWLSLVPGKDPAPTNEDVRPAVIQLLQLADEHYAEGNEGLAMLPNGARFAIRVAGSVYREIGNEIQRQQFEVMKARVFVPWNQKILLVGRCFTSELGFRVRRFTHSIVVHRNTQRLNRSRLFINSYSQGRNPMKNETSYLLYFGLSLTLMMATTLFILVGINPKQSAYETLPWIYSGVCAVLATVTGLLARRYNGPVDPQAAKIKAK